MKLLRATVLILAFSIIVHTSEGQVLDFAGSRYQALADASVGLTGCWSAFGNQSGLAGCNHPEIAGAFQNRYLVSELSTRIGLLVIPVQSTVVAFSLYQFGEVPFRQEKFGIAFARRIFPKLSFGLQFNYYRLFLAEANRSVGSAGLELGIQYLPGKKLNIGLHVLNPYQTSVKTYSEKYNYPSRINFGAGYHLSAAFLMVSEIEHDFAGHFRVKTGMEYSIMEKLYLRTGILTNPYQLSSGIGFHIKKLAVDLGDSFHSNLGNSPSVTFNYHF